MTAAAHRWSTTTVLQTVAVLVFLWLVTLRFLIAPLDRYDEGVVVTKAVLLMAGHVPYRDFWDTYGPLDTLLLAAAFKAFAVNIVVERLLGALSVAAIGAVAFLLLRVAGLRGGMRLLMSGLIAAVALSVPAFNTAFLANLIGLLAVLFFLTGLNRPDRRWPVLVGAMIGLSSFARPEFAIALGLGLLLGYAVLALSPPGTGRRSLLAYLAASLLTTAALWLPVVAIAGIGPLRLDLVTYALQLYPKARSIPFGQGPEGMIVIAFSGAFALVWIWAIVHALRRRSDPIELARVLALLVAAIAVFTWVRTRADGIHALDAWPLTAALLALLIHGRQARSTSGRLDAFAGVVGILLLSAAAGGLAYRDWIQPHANAGIPRSGVAGERAWIPADELAEVVRLIDRSVPQGGELWVGLQRNDLVTFNDTMLYFLSGRQPGTVYYETLPGLTNSDAIERQIGCQLVQADVRLAVLGPNPAGEPWNLSSVPGSRYLDGWLARHTITRTSIGPYELLRLTPGPRPDEACPSSGHDAPGPGSPATP